MRRALAVVLLLAACAPGGSGSSATDGGDGGGAADGLAPSGNVDLPGGEGGISFDDLRFSPGIGRVLAPGSDTGNVYVVDPATLEVTTISGFQRGESLDEGRGFLFVADRGRGAVEVVDLASRTIVAEARTASPPDYVRYVAPTDEVWVTEPGSGRIEVFALAKSGPPTPTSAGFVPVPGGPEGFVADATRGRGYAHLFTGSVVAIDLAARAVVEKWPTGCATSHGIPQLDEARGLVFAGCRSSAEVVVLDAAHGGAVLGRQAADGGESILAYSPSLHHFYLRGDPGTTLAVLGMPASGAPAALTTFTTAEDGHGAAADDRGFVWVCDAAHGRLQRFADGSAATP